MDLILKARELGKALQEDALYKAYKEAEEQTDNDTNLQEMIGEFNLKRMALNQELAKNDKDTEKVQELNEVIKKLYGEIMEHPTMVAYNNAKEALDLVLSDINAIITLCANGEDPDTCQPHHCGGECGSCGGCH